MSDNDPGMTYIMNPSPKPRLDTSMIESKANDWLLNANDGFERAVMEIVRLHRAQVRQGDERLRAAIDFLKNV